MAEGRGGVVKKFLDHTTPSARTNEASRLFRDRATKSDGPPPAEEGSREPYPVLVCAQTSFAIWTHGCRGRELWQESVAELPCVVDRDFTFRREPSCVNALKQCGIAIIPDFAEPGTFRILKDSVMKAPTGKRIHIPLHKRGITHSLRGGLGSVIRNSPAFTRPASGRKHLRSLRAFGASPDLRSTTRVPASLCASIYDRPGDRIGWHYDHNLLQRPPLYGIAVIGERTPVGAAAVLSAELQIHSRNGAETVPTPPNTLVLFEGAFVRHTVTPLFGPE